MSMDFELFPGKSLSGLFQDIYNNQVSKKERISQFILELKKLIRSNNTADIVMIAPIIRDMIDTSVKNDDHLIKLATVAQRIISSEKKSEGDVGFLTDEEKEQLLKTAEEIYSEVSANEVDKKIKEAKSKLDI
jgi:DNA repair photolyase